MSDTEFFFNGEKVTEDEMYDRLDESQLLMEKEEERAAQDYGVSKQTASAICYLRTRSRWTREKEQELVDRDKAGNPISLNTVLSGDF